nr:MAG TPA: hypothetical protein [Caudoviricetes sp.]
MKGSTIFNLVWGSLWLMLGLCALVGAMFYGAWWHYFTAAACALFTFLSYNETENGTEESVIAYFQKVYRRNK